jgi:hypothetical protein
MSVPPAVAGGRSIKNVKLKMQNLAATIFSFTFLIFNFALSDPPATAGGTDTDALPYH